MSRFENQVSLWWDYIDHIALYYLRSPLPFSDPTFAIDRENQVTSTSHLINWYSPVDRIENANINALRTFMIPKCDRVVLDDLIRSGETFDHQDPSGQYVIYGHIKELTDFEKNIFKPIDTVVYQYLQKVYDTFNELKPSNAWVRIAQSEGPDSKASRIVNVLDNHDSPISMFSGLFGNYDLYTDRLLTMKSELLSIYDALGVNRQKTRAELYFKGVDYVMKTRERELQDETDKKLFKYYNRIYTILLDLLTTYVHICRPFIHDRMYRLILRKDLESVDIDKVSIVFDTDGESCCRSWCTSKQFYESGKIEEMLDKAIQIMEDTVESKDGCTLKFYFPWEVRLMRFNDGGTESECHN